MLLFNKLFIKAYTYNKIKKLILNINFTNSIYNYSFKLEILIFLFLNLSLI